MAIFYATTGVAQGTGTGVDEANRIELKKAIENDAALHTPLVAGSAIYCKDDGTLTYDGSAGNFVATSVAGTVGTGKIRVVGYTTSIADDGVVTINDSNAGATNFCFDVNHSYHAWFNIKITNPRDGWNAPVAVNGNYWKNCSVIDAVNESWDIEGQSGNVHCYEDCLSIGAGNSGFDDLSRASRFIRCVSIGSGADGFTVGSGAYGTGLHSCISHANGGNGFNITGEGILTNCVASRNTSDGFQLNDAETHSLSGCVAASNGAYGIVGNAAALVIATACAFNPTNETNTSGKSLTLTLVEFDEITGDPLFTDSNPGTAADVDLSLGAGSALLRAPTSNNSILWDKHLH